MDAIFITNEAGTEGRMTWDGGEVFGPLPPRSGESRPIYDRLIAQGVKPEPYVPPPPSALMPDISDRQFGEGLWRDGLISYEDYLAFVGPGTIPPPLQAIINTLPDDDTGKPTVRKIARGLISGAQSYRFDNPFVDVLRQAQHWTVDHLRERWLAWSKL